MAEPDNLVLSVLREMRRDIDHRFDGVDEKLASQDKKIESIRQALQAETALGRYAVVGVEERLEAIEKRLDDIETSR